MATSTAGSGSGEAHFAVPTVTFNPAGWGPTTTPAKYQHVPYAPFSKGDKLGRVADVTGFTKNWHRNRHQREGEGNTEFAYRHDDDDDFTTVDNSKTTKKHDFRRRPQRARRRPTPRENPRLKAKSAKMGRGSFNKRYDKLNKARMNSRRRHWEIPVVQRESSVKVEADWEVLEQCELAELSKRTAPVPVPEDIKWCGSLDTYDTAFDRVSSKTEVKLKRFADKEFFYVSARYDPELQDLARDGAGNVFATDHLLAALMAAPRTVFPWDIVITYASGLIFLDVRDGPESALITVNETTHEPPSEDKEAMNGHRQLSIEASAILQNFTQQVMKKNRVTATGAPVKVEESKTAGGPEMEEHPFFNAEESKYSAPASIAYRYRKFKITDDITVVARCHLNAVSRKKDKEQLMTIFALNEFDPKVTKFRKKVDSQRGAVVATELKNNAAKMAKWTSQSLLAGADVMKIGFVARKHANDNQNHGILGTQLYKPKEFAHQVSLEQPKMWGIIKWVVDLVRKHANKLRGETPLSAFAAKFLLLKDPNRSLLRLYQVPMEAFEEEEEDEEWSEGEGED